MKIIKETSRVFSIRYLRFHYIVFYTTNVNHNNTYVILLTVGYMIIIIYQCCTYTLLSNVFFLYFNIIFLWHEWVSEWLLFITCEPFVSTISCPEQVPLNEIMSSLSSTNILHWIFIVLTKLNNSPRANVLLYSDTLPWLWTNPSSLSLHKAAFLAEKQQMPFFIVFYLIRPRLGPMIYHTHFEHPIPPLRLTIFRSDYVVVMINTL